MGGSAFGRGGMMGGYGGGVPGFGAGGVGTDGSVQFVEVPKFHVGKIIGRGGEIVQLIQEKTGCRLQIDQHAPEGMPCKVSIMGGPPGGAAYAMEMIQAILDKGPPVIYGMWVCICVCVYVYVCMCVCVRPCVRAENQSILTYLTHTHLHTHTRTQISKPCLSILPICPPEEIIMMGGGALLLVLVRVWV